MSTNTSTPSLIDTFRKEVETHLSNHPMGVDYFGMVAARNPSLVRRLREGRGVNALTIDKVREYMRNRERELSPEVLK